MSAKAKHFNHGIKPPVKKKEESKAIFFSKEVPVAAVLRRLNGKLPADETVYETLELSQDRILLGRFFIHKKEIAECFDDGIKKRDIDIYAAAREFEALAGYESIAGIFKEEEDDLDDDDDEGDE